MSHPGREHVVERGPRDDFQPRFAVYAGRSINRKATIPGRLVESGMVDDRKGKRMSRLSLVGFVLFCSLVNGLSVTSASAQEAASSRPNVLFISVDDLNDWAGCLGGHPQAFTPNLDRLAKTGILFTNAHCAAPSCNPSRSAIFTGISPHRSGLYDNRQKLRDVLPTAEIIPQTFSRNGYVAKGSGKLLHYFIDAASWDDYFPEATSENPFPRTMYPTKRPLSLPRKGEWQYVETDWGPLPTTDEEYGGDFLVAEWISKQLQEQHDKPFFLACGLYRPHEPWFVPEKYFEPFPLESIQLPPGYRADDLTDLPESGKRRGPNRYFAHIQEQGQWKQGIQGYLASIYFADAMLGKVLDALESGPHAQNTIVMLWSDHGWHLGEKEHWQKYTAWRACTRVPLVVSVPPGAPGFIQGTKPAICSQPVNLISLFPTLLELCGLPAEMQHDGPSLVPLLRNPKSDWQHPSVTFLEDAGGYGMSTHRWRYIHYQNGDEEFYDIEADPFELTNLVRDQKYRVKLQELRSLAPLKFASKPAAMSEEVSAAPLVWKVSTQSDAPPSTPNGNPVEIEFFNNSTKPIKMFVLDQQARPSFAAIIYGGRKHVEKTRQGVVFQICDGSGYQRGYFRVGDRSTNAIIPPE